MRPSSHTNRLGGDRMPAYYSAGRPCQMRFGNITLPFQIPQDPVLFRIKTCRSGLLMTGLPSIVIESPNLAVSFV